jgi:hypothetical protein
MHTLIILGTGFLVLAVCALIGKVVAGRSGLARACLWFVPVWFIGAGINMYIGVSQAGYSLADEAPIFVVVFAIPAAVAWLLSSKLQKSVG